MWQDWVLTCAQVVFVVALLPAIFHSDQKPPLLTSVPTVLGLVATVTAYISLSLWWSALAASLLTLGWAILAFQRLRLDTRARKANEPSQEL